MFPQYQYPFNGFPQFPAQQVQSEKNSSQRSCTKPSSPSDLNRFCRLQGFPYFISPYGFPQQRNPVMPQLNNAQQALERTTQRPQLPLQVRWAVGHREEWEELLFLRLLLFAFESIAPLRCYLIQTIVFVPRFLQNSTRLNLPNV